MNSRNVTLRQTRGGRHVTLERINDNKMQVTLNVVRRGPRGQKIEFAIDGGRVGFREEGADDYEWVNFGELWHDYNFLDNKPSIEGVELIHDKTLSDLGVEKIEIQDIDGLF